ncbi:MAG: ABC transporter permease [Actinomycetota bacterium]|nr:ABC transporter permease [Actinomycetota bacterium]
MRALIAAFRLQLRVLRTDASQIQTLAMVPLFTVIFVQIVRHAGREDLTSYAVLAPALIAVWALALQSSGEVIEEDRLQGTLELVVGSPTPFAYVVLARVLAVTLVSLVAFAEVWLVSWAVFGVVVDIHHPREFVLTILATALATAGTATIMASLFIVTRSPRTFQNSLSWPFYVVGGVLVPVAFLPDWLQPLSTIVFLSWSADLLRASLAPESIDDVGVRLAMILLLGTCGFAIGFALLARMLRQARRTATLGLA